MKENITLLPWQQRPWEMLVRARRQGRLSHALMLHGPEGTGKNHFAHLLAQALLCHDPDDRGLPCGTCRACTLYQAGNHPDLHEVTPLEGKQQIGVDQIRAVTEFLTLKPQYGAAQCLIITPAENLNEAAANALLKTLEEPTAGACLILVTARPAVLPATIRSRCQKVAFPVPPPDMGLAWLERHVPAGHEARSLLGQAGGAPLKALALAEGEGAALRQSQLEDLEHLLAGKEDAVALAAKWLKSGAKESLYGLYGWTADLIRWRLGGASRSGVPDWIDETSRQRLTVLAQRLDDDRDLFRRLDEVSEALRLLDHQLNEQLLLEDVLIAWQEGQGRNAA